MSNSQETGDEKSLEAVAIQTAASSVPAFLTGIVKYGKYPFKVGENIEALKLAVKELEAKEKDVLTVKETIRNPNFPASTIDGWLDLVKEVKNEAKHIIEQYDQHRIRFLRKFGPDPIISRKAEKKLPAVMNLCSNQIIINLISHAQTSILSSAAQASSTPSRGVKFNVITSGSEFEVSVQRKKK